MVYIIEDTDTEQIYLIGENGIEMCEQYTGLSDTISITIDEPISYYSNCGTSEGVTIKKGEIEMKNEVLELYDKRKKKEIEEQFERMVDEEYDNLPEVKRYNELINEFSANLAQLADEYNKGDNKTFVKTAYVNSFEYELNFYLRTQIYDKYVGEKTKAMEEHTKFVEEVRAVLSLSNSEEYQVKVLTEYGILNKKGLFNE